MTEAKETLPFGQGVEQLSGGAAAPGPGVERDRKEDIRRDNYKRISALSRVLGNW
jgi:hypothetical protein